MAKAISDSSRAKILMTLADGRALPASRLADEAGISASTVSTHLRSLCRHGLIEAEPSGRWRFYRLKSADVAEALESLAKIAPTKAVTSLRTHRRTQDLRAGRTCYKHLAGRLGVDLFASMLGAGWITGGDGKFHPEQGDTLSSVGGAVSYRLTAAGTQALTAWNIPERVSNQDTSLKYCVDWTEQAHHLAGPLGTAIYTVFRDQEWIRPGKTPRSQKLTDRGQEALDLIFAQHRPSH